MISLEVDFVNTYYIFNNRAIIYIGIIIAIRYSTYMKHRPSTPTTVTLYVNSLL